MTTQSLAPRRHQRATVLAGLVLWGAAFLPSQGCAPRPEQMTAGKFPEQLVYVRSQDDVVSGGVIFTPPKESAKEVAVIWVHGWGANFYQPAYVAIGRALAERGYPCIIANTRMHDLGNVLAWRGEERIRGGGYWGKASEQVNDLAAWMDFAADRGFNKVVMVGHSAGWAAVRSYPAETHDERVVGMVFASGPVRFDAGPSDRDQIAQATRMMADGHPDDLVRDPNRSFPSFISAATMVDIITSPPEYKDFFGTETATKNPGITRIRCPLLAFFGTRGDVGTEEDLELLQSSIKRQSSGPSRVDAVMIRGGDHMYTGEEAQVAETIANWADTLLQPAAREGGSPAKGL